MSTRTELPSILTRALIAAAAARAQEVPRDGSPNDLFKPEPAAGTGTEVADLAAVSEQAHRMLAGLITLLLLELEGLVSSPLNSRTRARVRLGAPSGSRVMAEWPSPIQEAKEGDLFRQTVSAPTLPIGRDPEAFFRKILQSVRAGATFLNLEPPAIEEMIRWLLPAIIRCDPEDDPVGWIHAHAQRHRLHFGPGQRLRFQVDRARGRSHGVLYTPPPLTEALVQAILATWSHPEAPAPATLFGKPPAPASEPPRILDPSCGSGQFLLSIARHFLEKKGGKPEEVLAIFRGMHGVDIDAGAATLAAFNLSLQAVRALCTTQGADPPTAVAWLEEQLGPGFPWFLGSQIHQGNALLLTATEEGTTFRWTDRFAEVFSGDRPGFDIVIGNPPWVSYGLRDRAGPEEEESSYLRKLYTFGAQYKLSLYPLFIELALRLARPGGLHGFLVPDSFFTGRHFSKIRAHMLETSQPVLFCLVESGPWPGVHVGHTAFYCVRRLPALGPAKPVTTCVVQLPPPSRHQKRRGRSALPLFGDGETGTSPVQVDPAAFRSTPHQAFRIYRDEEERRFVEQLERCPLRIEDLVETYSGLIARFGQESVTGPHAGEFILRDRADTVLVRDPKPEPRWKPALHSGAEVEPFRTQWRGGRLYIPDDRALLRRVYKSGFDLQRYERPKLFLRQTGDQLVSARDTDGLLCLNNVHILASKAGPPIDLRFLCGLLLSETMQRYYQAIALEAGRPLAQVDLATVRTLPYPCDANGAPYGICLESQQELQIARQIGERIDSALEAQRTGEVVSILREAIGYEQVGRVLVTAAICRLVENLENQRDPEPGNETRTTLDIGIALLFGVDLEPCSVT